MKKLLVALFVLTIIAGAIMFLFIGKLDHLVKKTIETEGTAVLGSKVRVGQVVTDLKQGRIVIHTLTVANPNGYSNRNAIEIGSFRANVNYANQTIEELIIQQPIIYAEQRGKKNNFQELLENMPADETGKASADEDELVLTIKRLTLKGATINLIARDLKLGDPEVVFGDRSFVMDDFVLNDLSGTATEISDLIAKSITTHISSQVATYMKDELAKMAKDEAKDKIKEKLGKRFEDLKRKLQED